MKGIRKAFDPQLAEWSSRAERELGRWLRGHGYTCTNFPDGKYGIDLKAENEDESFKVEIERRRPDTWPPDSPFPYKTVHVPERRARYGESGWLMFTIRKDIRAAQVTFARSLQTSPLIEVCNREVSSGEFFYDVPLHETLPVDLTKTTGPSIAELNASRIRAGFPTWHWREAMQKLGDVPPYGLPDSEWRDMRDKAEERYFFYAHCNCKDRELVAKGQRYNKWAMHCPRCDRLIGYKTFSENNPVNR